MPNIEGTIADVVVSIYNANPGPIKAVLADAENGAKTLLTNVIKNIHAGGIAGIVLPYLTGGVESYVDGLIASHTPDQLYTLIGAWLASEAKSLGG